LKLKVRTNAVIMIKYQNRRPCMFL